jgi:hypothetical protein
MLLISDLTFYPPFKGEYPSGRKKWTLKPATTKVSGIYVIKEDRKIVYIGMSQVHVYKTAYRHFHQWNCYKQYRCTYFNKLDSFSYRMGIHLCNPLEAIEIERMWIDKYNPRDNRLNEYVGVISRRRVAKKKAHNFDDVPF